jgi:cytochrome c biogenesis protein CcmG, thiol:disulfide interchange protein DsbE
MTNAHDQGRPSASRHRRRWVPVALVLAVAVVGAAAGSASAATPTRQVSTKITVDGTALDSSDNIGNSDDPAIGLTAPTISGQGFDGQKVSFANDGKPRMLIFLAHWCPHCRAEVPRLVKLAKQGKLAGVEVQAVVTGTNKDLPNYPPSKWLAREKWPFTPVLADDSKSRALSAFGGPSYPFFVLISADGKVAARATGELAPDTIAKAVKALAAGTPIFN